MHWYDLGAQKMDYSHLLFIVLVIAAADIVGEGN